MNGERGGSLRAHRASTDRGKASKAGSRVGRALRPALMMVLVAGALTSAVAVPHQVSRASDIRPFVVRGHVRDLYPGVPKQMRVVVRNPESFPVRLTLVTARVWNASRACRARNVRVFRSAASKMIPAHDRVPVYLVSRLRRTAPNACQGARFPVTFTATLARA